MKYVNMLTLTILLFFFQYLPAQQSVWTWQNPLPQGNTLWDVCTIGDDVVFAVGDAQTILKSTDGGINWDIKYISDDHRQKLFGVFFLNNNLGWSVGTSGQICKTSDGGHTWNRNVIDSLVEFHSVEFANTDTGWTIGNDDIFKSVDGGDTWNRQYSLSPSNAYLSDLSVINSNTVWVAVRFGNDIDLLYTTDGGTNWQTKDLGTITGLNTVYFFDSQHGWAGTTGLGEVYSTVDSGQTWNLISQGVLSAEKFHFMDSNNGFVLSGIHLNDCQIWRTTDGGYNWTLQVSDENFVSMDFSNTNQVGWIVGYNGTMYKSDDSGQTWINDFNGTLSDLWSIQFINENIGYAVGLDSAILKTTDGGNHWFYQNPGTNKDFFDCYFHDELNGLIAGGDGIIIRTNDAGYSWQNISSGTINHLYKIFFLNDQIGFIAGEQGTILKTADGGLNWTVLPTNTFYPIESVWFTDAYNGWAVGGIPGHGYKTTDGGNTWFEFIVSNDKWYFDVYFIDQNVGFIIGHPGVIMRTDNGGTTWTELPAVTDKFLNKIQFIDSQNGCISAAEGVILRTEDGGITWEMIHCMTSHHFMNLFFLDDGQTGWVCGTDGTILKTTTAGFPVAIPEYKKPLEYQIKTYHLSKNYPNPFNPSTTIEFDLPKTSEVSLRVFNILGEEVATLVSDKLSTGSYSYEWDASEYASGVYLYRLQAGNYIETRKMVLMR